MINTFICKVFVCKLRNFKKENTKKGENIYKPLKLEDVGIFHPNLKKKGNEGKLHIFCYHFVNN